MADTAISAARLTGEVVGAGADRRKGDGLNPLPHSKLQAGAVAAAQQLVLPFLAPMPDGANGVDDKFCGQPVAFWSSWPVRSYSRQGCGTPPAAPFRPPDGSLRPRRPPPSRVLLAALTMASTRQGGDVCCDDFKSVHVKIPSGIFNTLSLYYYKRSAPLLQPPFARGHYNLCVTKIRTQDFVVTSKSFLSFCLFFRNRKGGPETGRPDRRCFFMLHARCRIR